MAQSATQKEFHKLIEGISLEVVSTVVKEGNQSLDATIASQGTNVQKKINVSEEKILITMERFHKSSQLELERKMSQLHEELEKSFKKKILLTNLGTLLTAAAALATYIYFFQ